MNPLNSKMQFQTRSIQVPYECTANGQFNTNLKTLIDADIPSGYSCLGVVGYSTNEVNVYMVAFGYYDSAYSLQVKNASSSARSGNITVRYLTKHN